MAHSSSLQDLFSAAAKGSRENLIFEKGGEVSVGMLDDHAIHLEEHRLYALQKTFGDMAKRNPLKAERMYAHIALHESALGDKEKGEEQNVH